ncbi:hypothetical protein [Bradyrhizobium elkanii]|uniref:hypothetical protein n=1 Tax=Bradyrhizobium elkanii TaxID=29448 RepID=UPI002FF42AB3
MLDGQFFDAVDWLTAPETNVQVELAHQIEHDQLAELVTSCPELHPEQFVLGIVCSTPRPAAPCAQLFGRIKINGDFPPSAGKLESVI